MEKQIADRSTISQYGSAQSRKTMSKHNINSNSVIASKRSVLGGATTTLSQQLLLNQKRLARGSVANKTNLDHSITTKLPELQGAVKSSSVMQRGRQRSMITKAIYVEQKKGKTIGSRSVVGKRKVIQAGRQSVLNKGSRDVSLFATEEKTN